jgi:predicted Zn-dependent protease with MMP-like domain
MDPTEAAEAAFDVAADTERPLDAFEQMVERAIEAIPYPFSERLGSVAIVIEDWPRPDQLATVGAPGLLGLYEGIPRTAWSADQIQAPSKITIFRGPLERIYRDPDALAAAVENTVLHEVAHHFGISDERLREIGR